MPEAGESELLFFDTFSHENTEELNLDLVQFPRPVLIHEVRVVPLGTRVQADVPGGTRLGATNPSSFKLDLFVNNLTKPNAATFEKLGVLDYKGNDNIQLPLEVAVPTDGLIIKGWYSTITLAVYGCPTTVTKDRSSPPPPPPPRSKAQGDCLMVIPPAVIDNVQQNQALPQQVNNAANKTPQEWDPPVIKPGSGTPISGTNQVDQPHSYQQPSPNSAVAGPVVVAPTAPTAVVPAPQKTPNVEIFHDIDERFSGVQPGLQAPTQKEKNPGDKKAPQVEFDEHGEAKFPKGEFESDELFEAYLREKDRKREEEKRERAERERERAERYRKESRSRTPDKVKGHSRDHTRSTSRSRSRSTDREYRRSSRDREYRDGGTRDYREHRDSDREYRERDRYSDRGRADSRDRRDSRERDRRDSRERDRRDSRERDKEGKDRHDSRDRDHSKSQGSQDKPSSRDRPRDRDRRDSGDRGRERTPERNKSPKSRTPRRSRSRTPPLRRSRSRSRERDRNYDRERGREYREKDRDREKDYDKGRDREKERENFRERDKDYDREYRVDRGRDRDSRYDREKDKERERDGWSRTDRRDIEGERPWDKNNRDVRDIREQATVPEGEWDRSREQHPLRDPALLDQPPPVHPQHALREPIPVRDSHNQRNQQWHPDDIVPPQPSWNREVPPSAVDNTVQVWPHNDRVQQDSWARGGGRLDEMQGTWAPPPQVVQQQPPPQFPIIPEEPIPTNTVIVPLPQEDIYEGMPTDIHGEEDEIYTPLSDGEIEEEPAYSDISSDENFLESLNDEEYQARLAELQSSMDGIEDPWNYAISSFNPYQVDLMPLETFTDPSLTVYELEKLKLIGQEPSIEMPEDARKIQTVIDKFKETVHHEEWVESMEGLIPRFTTGLSYLISKADAQDVINSLVETTFEGLDLNKAMQQPLTVYKVRHLKMGVRMAGGLCACDTYVSLKLITAGVQHKLIDLFESKYIFATMKLNIIRALDSTVNLRDGMDWFLGKHPLQLLEDKSKDNDVDIPYKRYLKMMMTKEMSRVMVAMTALLRKIHVYELLNKFTAVVEVLAENTSFPDSKAPAAPVSNDTEVDMEADVEPEMPLIPDNMTADDIENLISCLQEVTKVILNTDNILGQPPKILPSRSVFSIVKPPAESTQTMFHLFTSTQLLEGVFVLLSSPATFNHNGVFNAIKDLLVCMISTQSGLLYMCSKHETVNGIIRALTQTLGYTEEDDEGGGPRGPHPAHLLGLQLIYYLQTLQNIDRLREYHAKGQNEKDLDDAEPLGLLHCLYMMTFTPQGRDAVVHVFTMADNLGALLPFIELPGDDALDVKVKRSVCHSYTVLLLLLIVRHSENVQYLEKYSQQLLTFAQHEPASNKTFDKVTELQDWLSPLKKVSVFQYETAIIAELVKLVKHYSDEVTDLPKGLVTTLRIIKHLCLHPENPVPGYEDKEGPVEMKFKYAVIEVYSSEAMPLFQLILQKLGEMLTRPFQQILPKMGMPRMVIMYTVTPVLSLVKAILQHLIGVRQSTFADLTMLNCLFQVHTVMCSVSHSGTLSPEAQCIQNTVVDILMTYTQPSLTAEQHTEEALAKSLWTMMCKELLKYVITAPYTFLSGLILTSELLPLPLPIQTKEPMTAQEVQVAINQRKLWSAHLHPLSNHIQDILQNLSGSACQPLQQLLRRVCWQLADLAGPSALMVVRCLLETVTESMDASIEINMTDAIRALPPEERPLVEYKSSAETAKILNLLAFLMNQPPVKTAFIYLSSGKSKLSGDEKHTKVLLRLARLLNVINEKSPHIQAQESIVSIFQSLCDLEVTMIPAENNMAFVDQLANSLPPRDQMAIVCEAMLLHIDQRDHNFSSILPALRTLALLMLHDFGFYHVKIALEKVPRAFYNLFQQINNTFSKDSSDCIATLSSAIELLQFLVALPEAPEGEEQTVPFERTYLISYKDLRDVLQWNKDPAAGHPLSDLDTLLHEYAKEEETLKAVYESVNLVVSILKSDEDQPKPDMFEPMLPEPEALPAQFEMRSIYLITDDEDDRLSATYWLATPMGEDSDDKEETVRVDFEEIAHKYCQDFDLVAEIEKGAVQSDPPIIKRRRSRIGRRLDTINTSKMRGKNGRFVAPMRGRGYGRVMPINKNDMFRSRPQNTSRPPSMHVDDFIKMELQGGDHPQIGPTGMNPHLTKFREQFDSGRGRGGSFHGRGRGRGNNSRGGGRFFSPPSNNYQRRDNTSPNMGGWGTAYNGGHSGSPTSRGGGYRGRGSATGGINTRGSPPKPPQSSWGNRPPRQDFNQSGFHYRGSTAGEWGQRNDRGGGRGFSRGWGGGGGAWRGKDERRFMPPPGTPPFYGRRDNRHQRSFTK